MHEPVTSLWTSRSTRALSPGLAGDRRVDVVVVGGGVAGLAVASKLTDEGAEVLVLERHGVARGVTGGSTAKVTALHGLTYSRLAREHGPEAAAIYARANAHAVVEMVALVERLGIDCNLTPAAAFTYATTAPGREAVAAEADAARAAGLPVRVTDSTELPYALTAALVLDDQAHLDPVRCCEGLADRLGASAVAESTPVLDIEEDDRGCRAVTARGVVHADEAVIATHAPIVDPRYLMARCRPVRTYALAAEVDGPVPAGMYLSADEPNRSVRPAALAGASGMIVGGGGHPVGDERDARACLDELESWARQHFPVSSVAARWAAHDLIPADHLPFIGRLTGGSRRWVVTGMQKWGLSTSVVAAGIISAGIAGGEHEAARLFDSTRLRSSATADLGCNAARVAGRYVMDRVRPRLPGQAVDPDAIAPGDGAVLHTRHGLTAVYRDDEGRLHATSARCTHQGCVVRFNRAQASWDCPCHGSRFATDGTILAGPAVDGLRPFDLSG